MEARNAAGDLLSVSESGQVGGVAVTRTTRNWYDANGRLVATQDAAGGRTYLFHDAAGRLVATVDPTGAVVQTVYDRETQLIQRLKLKELLQKGLITKEEARFRAQQVEGVGAGGRHHHHPLVAAVVRSGHLDVSRQR